MFEIIVCVNSLGYIGFKNRLMNYLPSDLQNFKRTTNGHVVIMGRKTFESLPKGALPNRVNIVITSDVNFTAKDVIVVHSIEECIELCKTVYSDKIHFVIGGGMIYKEFLDKGLVSVIHMTQTIESKIGDVLFPILNSNEWDEVICKREFFSENDECDYIVKKYIRN